MNITVSAQKPITAPAATTDSTLDYDALFAELDSFIDSLMAPHSFSIITAGAGSRYFTYPSSTGTVTNTQKLAYTATAGYFGKSGFGISATGLAATDNKKLTPYQLGLTASYDYLKNTASMMGISFTRYITKDSLSFYTSPLQNEANVYYNYRKSWLKPSLFFTYGWGSRTAYDNRKQYISLLNLFPYGATNTATQEQINDFTAAASVRHDFYWLHVFGKNDFIRLTPQLKFTAGTQKFGFNQTADHYANVLVTPVLYNTQNVSSGSKQNFKPLSLTAYIKSEFSVGKFFVQPQIVLDDYLPAATNKFSTAFMINTGFIL